MMTKPPCKTPDGEDCLRRAVGCQSKCEVYLRWQEIHQQERASQWLYYAETKDADNHERDKWHKIGKRYHTRKRVGQR